MSWKKNVISYLMWFLYASLVTAALVSLGGLYCAEAGIHFGWGVLIVVAYIGLAGGIVFLLRKLAPLPADFAEKRRGVLLAAETVLVLVLLALGLALRVSGMEGITQSSEYYETAKVAAGQRIPQVVHGAVYFYLQVLHTLFTLLGNHYTGGIWLQIILQLLGSLFLFLTVRKLAGRIAGAIVFGFCMCGPYMIAGSLALSPEVLYFTLISVAAFLIASAGRKAKRPEVLLCLGVAAAFCCYIDIFGIMLLFLLVLKVLDYEKKNTDSGRRAETILLCLAVFVIFILGLMLSVFSDALLSGKSFLGVIEAWLRLYSPEGFRLPASVGSAGSGAENLILFGSMVFGVFGFWCDRKQERISPCIAGAGLLILGICSGVLTDEMPGFHYLYLFLALLAGIGLDQCLQPACAVRQEGDSEKAAAAEVQPEKTEGRMDVSGGAEKENADKEQDEALASEDMVRPEALESRLGVLEEKLLKIAEREEAERKAEEALNELEREKALKEEFRQETVRRREEQDPAEEKKQVKYIENPLPLPRKHKKRVMEYPRHISEEDDFDHPVDENDDFDI